MAVPRELALLPREVVAVLRINPQPIWVYGLECCLCRPLLLDHLRACAKLVCAQALLKGSFLFFPACLSARNVAAVFCEYLSRFGS